MKSICDPVEAWAASGAMMLTGPRDGPGLGPPSELPLRLARVADVIARSSESTGKAVAVDPLAILTERAALSGLSRRGRTSCGGRARLLRARDGWLALSLVRPSDFELLPAWLECSEVLTDAGALVGEQSAWRIVEDEVRARDVAELDARAALLGLAVGVLARRRGLACGSGPYVGLPLAASCLGAAPPRRLDGLLVVDLSSLWAGPLCGRILADAGATVVKVESRGRPDGARLGPSSFFDLMNAGKASVALDLPSRDAGRDLQRLLEKADVVIEASRPRALEQLGISAAGLTSIGPQVWISITGHGRREGRHRVAFGDDAAIAGGLASWLGDEPMFCADAVADPSAGLVAAAAALTGLSSGGRWLVEVSMAAVSGYLAGPTLEAGHVEPCPPAMPVDRGQAPDLGEDTERVLAGLG